MRLGAVALEKGVCFSVRSAHAERIWVSVFDREGETEIGTYELATDGKGLFSTEVPGLRPGTRYGFRADGPYRPEQELWFDPDKLLIDPYALEIDRPYVYDARLGGRRGEGHDTAGLMPKAVVVSGEPAQVAPPLLRAGGLVYEVPARGFTMRHPDVPEALRGTIAALAHPAVIAHLVKIGVSAVELMPITATMDERHLPPLGLRNAWGYNPVSFMALDPRLAPGGIAELSATVAALHAVGIAVILDLVFNHTAESDEFGPTVSLRGLDNPTYYRHVEGEPGRLVNDTGCGNTVDCNHPWVRELILDSLRHFVTAAGVDGFRFDLAPILGRVNGVFDAEAPLLKEIAADPILKDRVLIAEPWDIGPGGYRLGGFPPDFLEWNDRYRDDVRRFWRGDSGTLGTLATRLSGSSDIFQHNAASTRTVNFIAAHDGMALADIAAYERKHNEANGEQNRDGHNENLSWNNGVEGASGNADVKEQRRRDARAMLATLFASRGTIMLTAGDEFGRSQSGNNNAYAQDNEITWLDWQGRDRELEDYVAALALVRKQVAALEDTAFLTGTASVEGDVPDVEWLAENGKPLSEGDWNDPQRRRLMMVLGVEAGRGRVAVLVNGDRRATQFVPPKRDGFTWREAVEPATVRNTGLSFSLPGRKVAFAVEVAGDPS
ncbi:glycogen debranching protein GlgX [Oryzicola mucosus]|uniref:Glycogen debranching protein GlgX n=1 Tax=Oryzicola mucosus TaxID=2767425 RepID=A0A8J6U5C5_9HYPH|nr:glycogen debranching protein GlgX [Oryzicola mucosus]MBD0415960.1 glycogen debranching protein GlgX [Oryzicola mucosus]